MCFYYVFEKAHSIYESINPIIVFAFTVELHDAFEVVDDPFADVFPEEPKDLDDGEPIIDPIDVFGDDPEIDVMVPPIGPDDFDIGPDPSAAPSVLPPPGGLALPVGEAAPPTPMSQISDAAVHGVSPEGIITYFLPMLPGAKLSFYPKKGIFEATCCNELQHKRCRKTYPNYFPKSIIDQIARPQSGRPCAYLMAWLVDGNDQPIQSQHLSFRPAAARRRHFRLLLKGSDVGKLLLSKERPKEPDEASEHSEDLEK